MLVFLMVWGQNPGYRLRQIQPRCGAKTKVSKKIVVHTNTMAGPEAMLKW